jgi:ribosome-associated protein
MSRSGRFGSQSQSKGKGPLTTSLGSTKTTIIKTTAKAAAHVSRPHRDAAETLQVVLSQLEDMKAEDTVTIDLRNKSSLADYLIVTTGRSNRHVGAIADRVVDDLGKVGVNARVEGVPQCDWVLIDAGDVIVHVFRPEVRTFYGIEKMWTSGLRRAS